MKDYTDTFPDWEAKRLEDVIPGADALAIDLLSVCTSKILQKGPSKISKQMLVYAPNKRISAKDALLHPYFDDMRDVFIENV